ncbi:DUF2190 family protein [Stenotrophomonas sp. CFBP8994]|jgi:predicted RecA/RadA family phage recombinase|uniref:DUF2190 family protein n=1 Tax=Stenotrophomonas sp. CFBP8994 TaxID=3096527 RepID=UPI002A6A4867|nr:DUF2190 family protein [Stenotrophomonas sp. CFBP8994]MDY0978945.1 DUF2190 family protein [Stenotrophomonas sp. CFBP8994]
MKNAHQDGRVLDVTLTSDAKSGELVVEGKLVGAAVTDGKVGEIIAVHVEGVFELPKLAAAVFAVGAPVNWDGTAKHAIAAAAGADQVGDIGFAVYAAAAGAATVYVRLTPGTAAAGEAGGA